MESNVLIVDDDPSFLSFCTLCLEQIAVRIETAESVDQALEYFEPFQPIVVLCDIEMPEKDGFVLYEHLVAQNSFPGPFIFLTAHGEFAYRDRAFRAGVDDFIVKPVSPEQLVKTVEKAMEVARARRHWSDR